MRITLLRDRLAHVIGEVIVVLDADVLVDAARGAARTARPHALDEGKPSRVHKCREVVGRLSLFLDAGVLGELRAQHAVVDDPNSGHDGGGGCHVISAATRRRFMILSATRRRFKPRAILAAACPGLAPAKTLHTASGGTALSGTHARSTRPLGAGHDALEN